MRYAFLSLNKTSNIKTESEAGCLLQVYEEIVVFTDFFA